MSALRHRRHPEAGTTVIEALVVMIILAVVGSIVVASLGTAMRSQRNQMAQADAMQELRVTLERVTRDLRAADPLQIGTSPSQVVSRVCTSGGYITRTYRLQTGTLLGPGNKVLARNLANSAAQPVFVYRDVHGVPVDLAAVPARVDDVASVTVRLLRTVPLAGAVPQVLDVRNRVTVRNQGGTSCF